jgi:exodeoxyribonuclease III
VKLVTWNVNSLTVRLPRLLAWLALHQPDIVCLQELKCEEAKFPFEALAEAGYEALVHGQKTYNGVAIVYKRGLSPTDVQIAIPNFEDPQARAIAATFGELRVICLYVVNGQAIDSDKFVYKQAWLAALTAWLKTEVSAHKQLAVLGDYNIAPADADVHDPAAWAGQVLCTDIERGFFESWLALGLKDSFRLFEQAPKLFSWWDYRMLGFQKNQGMRIDHILITEALAAKAQGCVIDKQERRGEKPSDHAPVVLSLA